MANGDCVQENGKKYVASRYQLDQRIRHRDVENKLECLGYCFEFTDSCNFWTYNNVEKKCKMMKKIRTSRRRGHAVKISSESTSGNRDCTEVCNFRTGEANITYPGNDLNDGRKDLTLHAKDCYLLCYKDMQCVGWVWKAKTGECWKKSKMENRTVDTELGTRSAKICEKRDPDYLDEDYEDRKIELYEYENEYES